MVLRYNQRWVNIQLIGCELERYRLELSCDPGAEFTNPVNPQKSAAAMQKDWTSQFRSYLNERNLFVTYQDPSVEMGVSKNKGTPKMDGLEWKTLLKWMIWGYHY